MSAPIEFDAAKIRRLALALKYGVSDDDLRERFGGGITSVINRLKRDGKFPPADAKPKRELAPDTFDDLFGPIPDEKSECDDETPTH